MNKAIKRTSLVAAAAVAGLVIVLAFAGVVAAAPATSRAADPTPSPSSTAAPYGWVLQLRGAINQDLTYQQFAALEAKAGVGATWTDTSVTPNNVYSGIPLWRLVALVDDKDPSTFNNALAAQNYDIQVVGIDGFTATLGSNDPTRPWVGDSTNAIVADKVNGAPLSFGFMKTKSGKTSWHPSWPLQLVSPNLPGSAKPGGAVTIIVYAPGVTPPASPTTLPSWILQVQGASNVDYNADQFHALATAHGATWTDTSVTPNNVYAGTPLWRLVALADGGSPATLNLDRLGLGYNVDVYGAGATTPAKTTFAATAIANDNKVVIADTENGQELTPTQGNVVVDGSSTTWQPTWPARIVGADVPTAASFGGVLRVLLEQPTVPSYLKPLVLKGRRTVKIDYLDFPVTSTWDGTKPVNINKEFRGLYRGRPLYQLIGMVDDKNPKTFNTKLARKGYTIELIASDGYTWTISSKTIIGKKHWIVASLKDGKALSSAEGPYRYVGSFIRPFYGKPSVKKLVAIKLIF
jgi:hypothetical protein